MRLFDWSTSSPSELAEQAADRRNLRRRGLLFAISVLSIAVLGGGAVFVTDLVRIVTARTELQVTADEAALTAARQLIDEGRLAGDPDLSTPITAAQSMASQYVGRRMARVRPTSTEWSEVDETDVDVTVGHLADPADPNETLQFRQSSRFNAVTVKVQTESHSGRRSRGVSRRHLRDERVPRGRGNRRSPPSDPWLPSSP